MLVVEIMTKMLRMVRTIVGYLLCMILDLGIVKYLILFMKDGCFQDGVRQVPKMYEPLVFSQAHLRIIVFHLRVWEPNAN